MTDDKVTIVLSGKRFDIDLQDKKSIQTMPWRDRKQLIGLLEIIKQAEHIKPQEAAPKVAQIKAQNIRTKPQLDPEIKPSETDIDGMMERFIMEGEKDRPKIPDKSSIYKLLLIIMAVLLGLSILF